MDLVAALSLTEDGYEVADAPPLDPTYAKQRMSWRPPCSR
jgi:hypothetical protein